MLGLLTLHFFRGGGGGRYARLEVARTSNDYLVRKQLSALCTQDFCTASGLQTAPIISCINITGCDRIGWGSEVENDVDLRAERMAVHLAPAAVLTFVLRTVFAKLSWCIICARFILQLKSLSSAKWRATHGSSVQASGHLPSLLRPCSC